MASNLIMVDLNNFLIVRKNFNVRKTLGSSLVVQWLGLCFTAEGLGSIPGPGTKIPQAMWHGQKIKEKKKRKTLVYKLLRKSIPQCY